MVFPQHELAKEPALQSVRVITRNRFSRERDYEMLVKYFAVSGDGGVESLNV